MTALPTPLFHRVIVLAVGLLVAFPIVGGAAPGTFVYDDQTNQNGDWVLIAGRCSS